VLALRNDDVIAERKQRVFGTDRYRGVGAGLIVRGVVYHGAPLPGLDSAAALSTSISAAASFDSIAETARAATTSASVDAMDSRMHRAAWSLSL
jgi:hypothetical protein